MNWLRAKARFERWDEEIKIVKTEMGCTIRDYENRRITWEKRADESRKRGDLWRGHICYALQQMDMWFEFEEDAAMKFGKHADLLK